MSDVKPGSDRLDAVYALWDALSDFGSQATDEALRYCMNAICGWIGAQNAFWIGSVRMAHGKGATTDPLSGWRIGAVNMLNKARTNRQRLRAGMQALHSSEPGTTTRAVVAGAGHFRVHTLKGGLVDLKAFRKTDHYDYFYRQPGVADRMWVVFPVNSDTESIFCFDKYGARSRFGDRAREIAGDTLRGVKWFHRQLLLYHCLGVGAASVAPAERRVVRELLSGASEKAIAERIGLTPATTHQYVTVIFRKFGVRGRAEFMSLWLNGRL